MTPTRLQRVTSFLGHAPASQHHRQHQLTLSICRLLEEQLDVVGRDGEGDPGGDLHGVYTDHFPVLFQHSFLTKPKYVGVGGGT